ncbi:MAG: aminopeptidase P family protein [Lachnospiraceae bacterium]|nr:aminopeptidase P family protein [Lachnospiraceae bacterium]
MNYQEVQNIARQTMHYIRQVIKPDMNLKQIRQLCEDKMLELGADSFWYWDIGAFCFAGEETTVSVSGKKYVTSDRRIQENDIITIDLSPQSNNIWGDYARTIILENGQVVEELSDIQNEEWRKGLQMEEMLHAEMKKYVRPETSFEALYHYINELIRQRGYENLDFMGNLGHSIVKNKEERIYIEEGNQSKLSDVSFFTFEPHIRMQNSVYGFKKENIYYFNGSELLEL